MVMGIKETIHIFGKRYASTGGIILSMKYYSMVSHDNRLVKKKRK
jgi:hypothetical protein